MLLLGLLFSGCSAGVNQDLAATATPRIPLAVASPPTRLILTSRDPALSAFVTDAPEAELARLDEMVEAGRELAPSRAARGLVHVRLGHYQAAEADFNAALQIDPGLVSAYTGRGLLTVATAQGSPDSYAAALQDFNRAITLDASAMAARLGRAWVFLDRARHRGERTDWETALAEAQHERLRDEPLAVAIAVIAYTGLGQDEMARQLVDGALERDPEEVRAAALMTAEAELELGAGRHDQALVRARAALEEDPYQWEARRVEAASLLALDRPEEARDVAAELVGVLPEDGRAWLLQADALTAIGSQDEATSAFERASELLMEAPAYSAAILQVAERLGVPPSPSPSPDDVL